MPCVQPQRADGLLLSLLGRTGAVDNPKSVIQSIVIDDWARR